MINRTVVFRKRGPVSWRIDAAEAARDEGADRVAYVPGPCGGDKYAFAHWAGWAAITICAVPVFGAARALYTEIALEPVRGYNLGLNTSTPFTVGRGLLGLDIECVISQPDQPTPDNAIDVDLIADVLPE